MHRGRRPTIWSPPPRLRSTSSASAPRLCARSRTSWWRGRSERRSACPELRLFQEQDVIAEFASGQSSDSAIQGHQFSLLLHRHPQQMGVGHLLVAEKSFGERLHRIEKTDVHRPETVARQFANDAKHLQRLADIERRVGELRVGHYSYETASFVRIVSNPKFSDPSLHLQRLADIERRVGELRVGHYSYETRSLLTMRSISSASLI